MYVYQLQTGPLPGQTAVCLGRGGAHTRRRGVVFKVCETRSTRSLFANSVTPTRPTVGSSLFMVPEPPQRLGARELSARKQCQPPREASECVLRSARPLTEPGAHQRRRFLLRFLCSLASLAVRRARRKAAESEGGEINSHLIPKSVSSIPDGK